MQAYIIKRVLAIVPTMLIVGVIVFGIIHLAPGDPAAIIAGQEATPAQVEAMRQSMGLNDPIYVQFFIYIRSVVTLDFGESIFSGFKVTTLLKNTLQPTISLAVLGVSFSIIVAVPLGVLAAWKFNTWIDRLVMMFALVGYAVPYFA
ncbi:MAG: ABC transporter permease, partial [Chloroflexi bacterium]|nr:ABC transporter permease [Chloroflexota bacterium]